LRHRCIKRDSWWKCYEIAKNEVNDENFQYSRQGDLKSKMAQKFFENLNMNEIKIMLDLKMDPRYTSDIQKTTTDEELSRAMRAQQDNSFYQQLM